MLHQVLSLCVLLPSILLLCLLVLSVLWLCVLLLSILSLCGSTLGSFFDERSFDEHSFSVRSVPFALFLTDISLYVLFLCVFPVCTIALLLRRCMLSFASCFAVCLGLQILVARIFKANCHARFFWIKVFFFFTSLFSCILPVLRGAALCVLILLPSSLQLVRFGQELSFSHCLRCMYVPSQRISWKLVIFATVDVIHYLLNGHHCWRQYYAFHRNRIWYTMFVNVYCTWWNLDSFEWASILRPESTVGISYRRWVAELVTGGLMMYKYCLAFECCGLFQINLSG